MLHVVAAPVAGKMSGVLILRLSVFHAVHEVTFVVDSDGVDAVESALSEGANHLPLNQEGVDDHRTHEVNETGSLSPPPVVIAREFTTLFDEDFQSDGDEPIASAAHVVGV